jgi:hypothetical protein
MQSLLKNPKFWLAVVGVVQSVVLNYIPSIPQGIWISIDALIAVVIASLTVDDAARAIVDELRARRLGSLSTKK